MSALDNLVSSYNSEQALLRKEQMEKDHQLLDELEKKASEFFISTYGLDVWTELSNSVTSVKIWHPNKEVTELHYHILLDEYLPITIVYNTSDEGFIRVQVITSYGHNHRFEAKYFKLTELAVALSTATRIEEPPVEQCYYVG